MVETTALAPERLQRVSNSFLSPFALGSSGASPTPVGDAFAAKEPCVLLYHCCRRLPRLSSRSSLSRRAACLRMLPVMQSPASSLATKNFWFGQSTEAASPKASAKTWDNSSHVIRNCLSATVELIVTPAELVGSGLQVELFVKFATRLQQLLLREFVSSTHVEKPPTQSMRVPSSTALVILEMTGKAEELPTTCSHHPFLRLHSSHHFESAPFAF